MTHFAARLRLWDQVHTGSVFPIPALRASDSSDPGPSGPNGLALLTVAVHPACDRPTLWFLAASALLLLPTTPLDFGGFGLTARRTSTATLAVQKVKLACLVA